MPKKKLFIPAILSLVGTSAYLITKKRKETKQDNIRQALTKSLSQRFGKENIKGYWIDFNNDQGLEYACGVNIENDDAVVDSYTFIFNPENNESYCFKIINSSFE